MEIVIAKNPEELSGFVSDIIISEINKKKDLVLGLATGDTPLMTYNKLITAYQKGLVDFSKVITFNLDEYVGLQKENKNSYFYYMHHNFFNHINIDINNINLLDGQSSNLKKTAKNYDNLIYKNNGTDLQLLGIGINGHIGFNEPDSELLINTHVSNLSNITLNQNSKFFHNINDMPKKAITMGLGTIMKSKRILLVATGKRKAEIIAKLLRSLGVSTKIPASMLLLHNNLTIMIDEEAAKIYLEEQIINENIN